MSIHRPLSSIRISECELSVRGGNLLRSYFGDVTLDVIKGYSDEKLLSLPHFTKKCLREIREVISNLDRPEPPPSGMPEAFPSLAFATALAATYHPQMEPESVMFMEHHFARALSEIGWTVQPKAPDGQTSDNE